MPFFFLCLLEATVASMSSLDALEEDAEEPLPFPPLALAALVPPSVGPLPSPVWISLTCCGGGRA